MLYHLEGVIKRREHPDKYMNVWVDYTLIKDGTLIATSRPAVVLLGRDYSKRDVALIPSGKIAGWLNGRGRHFVYNNSREIADLLADEIETKVSKTKVGPPTSGWEAYLTRRFGSVPHHDTLGGEIDVWSDWLRVPTPVLFFYSYGTLKGSFEFNGSSFARKRGLHTGTRASRGFTLELPIAQFHMTITESRKESRTYAPFSLSNLTKRPERPPKWPG